MEAAEIHENGLREMDRIQASMLEIARRSFGTDDVAALLDASLVAPLHWDGLLPREES